jgi:predicted nuclease with RNAse H fold
MESFYGIDYGKQYAGNTVICYRKSQNYIFEQVQKKVHTDKYILEKNRQKKPGYIFIDAPLSLPAVYSHPGTYSKDYFYRKCDRELGAMSPMFLGGLTARAIKLRDELKTLGIKVLETYPGQLAQHFKLKNEGYKKNRKNIQPCIEMITQKLEGTVDPHEVVSWHHFDALLCCLSAERYFKGEAKIHGDEKEGVIVF